METNETILEIINLKKEYLNSLPIKRIGIICFLKITIDKILKKQYTKKS